MHVATSAGDFTLWLDAKDGSLLQYKGSRRAAQLPIPGCGAPREFPADAFCPFEPIQLPVDPALDGQFRLKLSGQISEVVNLRDLEPGQLVSADEDFVPECTHGAPDAANAECFDPADPSRFNNDAVECYAYAIVLELRRVFEFLGAHPLEELQILLTPETGSFGGDFGELQLGRGANALPICPDFTDVEDQLSQSWDPTLVAHEFAHRISARQVENHAGVISGGLNEGLSDYWGAYFGGQVQPQATYEFSPVGQLTLARMSWYACRTRYWVENLPPLATETTTPCRGADPEDRFENRVVRTAADGSPCHTNGQIVHWALVSALYEMAQRASLLGEIFFNIALVEALEEHNSTEDCRCGIGAGGCTVPLTHEAYIELLSDLIWSFVGRGAGVFVNSVQAGFARANLFETAADAVVQVIDNRLSREGPAPQFEIWSGRPFRIAGDWQVDTTMPPFNPLYRLQVANDEDFSANQVDTGWLRMDGSSTTSDEPCPNQTVGNCILYRLPQDRWRELARGDRLYYKVQTDLTGSPKSARRRDSLCLVGEPRFVSCATARNFCIPGPRDCLFKLDPPSAVIN
jgi:hypothetical protein